VVSLRKTLARALLTAVILWTPLAAFANDLPSTLDKARDQMLNYVYWVANSSGVAPTQRLILNNLILPLDLDNSTPYFNDELFRLYGDATFTGGIEQLQQSTPAGQAERFSFQYKVLVQQAGYEIDQNHPEIANSLTELNKQLDDASTALNKKITDLDASWSAIAAARGLKAGTNQYTLEQITWQGQIHYRDQVSTLSKSVTKIISQINQVRRKVYTPSQRAVLDNIEWLSDAYEMARPWYAQVEIEQKEAGNPISSTMLNDAHTLNPGMFDIGPLILPQGNLASFLNAPSGSFGLDTGHQSYDLTQEQSSWAASGGVSWGGWSIGASGGGSSSYSNEVKTLNSISVHFDNIAEYKITRGGWFQPAVLRDPGVQHLLKGRPEFASLQYVAVSLILVRGTNITLKFSQAVNSSRWSQQSFGASGGVSFMGFGFSLGGGSNSSSYKVSNSADWTTVSFVDSPSVVRVIGVRVEPYLAPSPVNPLLARDEDFVRANPSLKGALERFNKGQMTYLEFQQTKIDALKAAVAARP
jgi:hypothetical protein